MARQKGIVKIKGTIGDMTFYKSRDGYMVREKGGVEASRIANDPAFQRTRENGAEFGRAGKSGKLIRTAFRLILMKASDGRMVSRLTRQMLKVIQSDPVSARGERKVSEGDLSIVKGFEFNAFGKLSTTLFVPYNASLNRSSGEMNVDIESFVPIEMITAPEGATHFKIVSGAAEIDFDNEEYTVATSESGILAYDETASGVLNLQNILTPDSTLSLFLLLGISFFQEVNGTMYPLRNGAFNPMSAVEVENGV